MSKKNKRQPSAKSGKHRIIFTCLILLCLVLAGCLLLNTDYGKGQLVDFGLADCYHTDNITTAAAWNSCLERLNTDADVVFFGDSLTARYDFQAAFPGVSVVNLGLSGDTILDMTRRVYMLKTVSPEKIFLMAGINSLKNEGMIEKYYNQYADLCRPIRETVPDAKLYIISVLPVSSSYDSRFLSGIRGWNNRFIARFNTMIHQYADDNGFIYINLYPAYEKDGALNPEYSADGLHITDASYRLWTEAIEGYVNE